MNDRERFQAVFSGQPYDRLPVYFFGTWPETKTRWQAEGLSLCASDGGSGGPQLPEMDPDWEAGLWNCHGLADCRLFGTVEPAVLEETADYRIERNRQGDVVQIGKHGSSIPHYLEHGLKPTRESWRRFQTYLQADDPRRRPEGWQASARALHQRDRVTAFMGGSLYGWLRGWMGVEALSFLMYDNPALFEEMVETVAQFFLDLYLPVVRLGRFDLVYFFEDCCFNNGPLFSPKIYRTVYDRHYRKMLTAYKDAGVPLALVDSDGKVDKLVPCWLDSGFDIVFPIEVGTWQASVAAYRRQYGRRLRMFGGFDKLIIPRGEAAIRAQLEALKPVVDDGGYLPIPDHRIPPDCSLTEFRTYLRVFREVFCTTPAAATVG